MEFLTTVSLEAATAELEVWNALKEALRAEEGYAFLRYPVFVNHGSRRYEPDILLLHRQLGFVVIEVKGCQARHVSALEGQQWRMQDWYSPYVAPYDQAQQQMWALRSHFWRYPELMNRVHGTALIALPFVDEAEWEQKGFTQLPCNPGILHRNHMTPAKMRKRLHALAANRTPLSDDEWRVACQVLGLRSALERTVSLETGETAEHVPTASNELIARIKESEAAIAALDLEQQRIGFEIPPGPQRIRGIAGSGKTLLLAIKAARMHLSHPDWEIAFTFNTKSLYQAVIGNIERFCLHFGDCKPNWEKLHVLHGWGSREEMGLYRYMAQAAGAQPRGLTWVKAQVESASPSEALAYVCRDLLASAEIPERFDAILIDEGQDFLPEFYQLAYAALRAPKRLIWAYDEAQSLEHLRIPNAETLFGRNEDGRLKVDLVGQYAGGILKSRIMRKCYRTPAKVLVPAHTFGMGLLREEGPVQLITTRQGWRDIGYEVIEGAFDQPGSQVLIERPAAHCPHMLDRDYEGELLRVKAFAGREAELEDCADRLGDLAGRGMALDDAMVVFLGPSTQTRAIEREMQKLAALLDARGLGVHMATRANASVFRRPGAVTLSGIHRAKGHEAAFVFVLGLDRLAGVEADFASRNQLFVGLTRARGLCRVSGLEAEGAGLFAELERVLAKAGHIRFPVPDPQGSRRVLDDAPEPGAILPFERHLPLYSDFPAAAGSFTGAREHDPEAVEWVDASDVGPLREDMFVLRIQGRSMEPKIPDGALAVFQRHLGSPPEGKIVLASLREAAENGVSLVVKRLDVQSDARGWSYRLSSLNPDFAPIAIRRIEDEEVRIEAVFKRVLEGPEPS